MFCHGMPGVGGAGRILEQGYIGIMAKKTETHRPAVVQGKGLRI